MIRAFLNWLRDRLPPGLETAYIAQLEADNQDLRSRLEHELSSRARVKWYQRDEYNAQAREMLAKRILHELVLGETVDPFDATIVERLRVVAMQAANSTRSPITMTEGICPQGFITTMELRIPEIVLHMEQWP